MESWNGLDWKGPLELILFKAHHLSLNQACLTWSRALCQVSVNPIMGFFNNILLQSSQLHRSQDRHCCESAGRGVKPPEILQKMLQDLFGC